MKEQCQVYCQLSLVSVTQKEVRLVWPSYLLGTLLSAVLCFSLQTLMNNTFHRFLTKLTWRGVFHAGVHHTASGNVLLWGRIMWGGEVTSLSPCCLPRISLCLPTPCFCIPREIQTALGSGEEGIWDRVS